MDYFFFQAEDGIRVLVRSRGLGDVYKGQARGRNETVFFFRVGSEEKCGQYLRVGFPKRVRVPAGLARISIVRDPWLRRNRVCPNVFRAKRGVCYTYLIVDLRRAVCGMHGSVVDRTRVPGARHFSSPR